MANFSVSNYRPSNNALDSMRVFLSAFGTQLQAKRMERDEAYRNRMEALNLQAHKADMELRQLKKKETKEGIENKRILAQTAKLNLVNSVLKGHMEIAQNGMGDLWSLEDIDAFEQDMLSSIDKVKDSGIVDPRMVDIYTSKMPLIIGTQRTKVNIFNKLKQESPFMINAVKEFKGWNDSQIAGAGLKTVKDIYDNHMASIRSRKNAIKEQMDAQDKTISKYETLMEHGTALDNKGIVASAQFSLREAIDKKAKLSEQFVAFKEKYEDLNGENLREYKKEQFQKAQDNQARGILINEALGMQGEGETKEQMLGSRLTEDQNRVDLAIRRGIFDESQREELYKKAKMGDPRLRTLLDQDYESVSGFVPEESTQYRDRLQQMQGMNKYSRAIMNQNSNALPF